MPLASHRIGHRPNQIFADVAGKLVRTVPAYGRSRGKGVSFGLSQGTAPNTVSGASNGRNNCSEGDSSSHLQGFFHQIESERLIRLCPCQGGVSIRNISPLFEKVKFRAQPFGGDLGERAIEIMNLFAKARGVRWIRKKALAIDYREDRIKDTPLRLAIRLQKGIAIIEALTEAAAHLRRGKPRVVVLTEVRIARIALDSDIAPETGLDEIEDGVLDVTRAENRQRVNQEKQRGVNQPFRRRLERKSGGETLATLGGEIAQAVQACGLNGARLPATLRRNMMF